MYVALCSILLASGPLQVRARESQIIAGPTWTRPLNLSRSGAASNPLLIAAPDGRLQAFWWDRFDGVMTSVSDGQTWSGPISSPLSKNLTTTPYITMDSMGKLNAFWLENGRQMYSQMEFARAVWLNPVRLAESVATFDITPTRTGRLAQVYVRPLNTIPVPSGLYFTKEYVTGSWSVPISIRNSIYFRPLTPEMGYIRVVEMNLSGASSAATAANAPSVPVLILGWDDPQQRQSLFSYSLDGGTQWQEAEVVGTGEGSSSHLRLAPLLGDKGLLRIWEESEESACKLYQQELVMVVDQASAANPTQPLSPDSWSKPSPIFENVSVCPQGDSFWPYQDGVIWIWGEGSDRLTLNEWQPGVGEWTEPVEASFRFEDEETLQTVSLDDLHAVVSGDQLVVIGIDPTTNEAWVTMTRISDLGMAVASPSSWAEPAELAIEDQPKDLPAVGIDRKGRTHLIWSVASEQLGADSPGDTLYYVRAEEGEFSRAVGIVPPVEGKIANQPALLVVPQAAEETDLLHLVWSGETGGQILYSRSVADEAFNPGSWTAPVSIASHTGAKWPRIGADASGRLYVLYIVPLNEARGVYLVSSADRGKSWSEPVQVFNAAASGWPMVDHPSLSVAPDGVLRAAWVQAPLPGTGVSQGIYYAYSTDGGRVWSVPFEIATRGYAWPSLAVVGGQVHLVFGQTNTERIYYRWAAIDQQGEKAENWSITGGVPGYQGASMPFDLVATYERLYLVVENSDSSGFSYSVWNSNERPGSWSDPEPFILPKYANSPGQTSSPSEDTKITVAAQPLIGSVAVVGLAPEILPANGEKAGNPSPPALAQQPVLYLTTHSIAIEEMPKVSVIWLEPTPGPTVSARETPSEPEVSFTPVPTFIVNQEPGRTGSSIPPLVWGGGLAAIIVVAFFAGYFWWMRGKS